MLFRLLSVISVVNAGFPQELVALKETKILILYCYNKSFPNNRFFPTFEYTIMSPLCGIKKIIIISTNNKYSCL
jgi:hypothetical protein